MTSIPAERSCATIALRFETRKLTIHAFFGFPKYSVSSDLPAFQMTAKLRASLVHRGA
jgi:hypothetical protein